MSSSGKRRRRESALAALGDRRSSPSKVALRGASAAAVMLVTSCAAITGLDNDYELVPASTGEAGGAGGEGGAGGVGGVGGTQMAGGGGLGGLGGAGQGGAGGSGGSGGIPVGPVCGDGNIDPGEQCDDSNDVPGDGCSQCSLDANEACPGSAVTLTSAGIVLNGDLTTHSDDSAGACGGAGGPDVVYAVKPSENGMLSAKVTPTDASFDFKKTLYIWTNCGDSGSQVACSGGLGPASAGLSVFVGSTYYVFVDGKEIDQAGLYTLTLTLTVP